jgi:hypothetical protein
MRENDSVLRCVRGCVRVVGANIYVVGCEDTLDKA